MVSRTVRARRISKRMVHKFGRSNTRVQHGVKAALALADPSRATVMVSLDGTARWLKDLCVLGGSTNFHVTIGCFKDHLIFQLLFSHELHRPRQGGPTLQESRTKFFSLLGCCLAAAKGDVTRWWSLSLVALFLYSSLHLPARIFCENSFLAIKSNCRVS